MDTRAAAVALRASFEDASKAPVRCPICAGSRERFLVAGDRHDLGLRTVLCGDCLLGYVSPRPAPGWFSRFYRDFFWPVYVNSAGFDTLDELYERDGAAEKSSDILDAVLPLVPAPIRRYLDLGSGMGAMLAALKARVPAAEICGIESSRDGIEFSRRRHGVRVHAGDLESLPESVAPGPFDLITLIHVLEHTANPVAVLRNAVSRLAPGGYLYAEVPDLASDQWAGMTFFHVAHILYFTPAALTRLLAAAGLEPVATLSGAARLWPWTVGLLARRSPRVTAPDPERPESALAIQAHVRRRVMAAEDSDRATYVQGCYVERLAERISAAGERRCVVYGAARVGTWLGRALRARGIQVAAFADGDPGRWNARVDGVPVLSPDAARNGSCHTYAIGSLASGEVIRREIGRRYEGASCRIYAGADQPGPEAISIHA